MARWTSRRFSTSFRSARVSLVGQKDGEPQRACPWPHPLLLCVLRDGGPPAFHGLGAPDQGGSQRPSWPPGESNLTCTTILQPSIFGVGVLVQSTAGNFGNFESVLIPFLLVHPSSYFTIYASF